MEDDFSRALLGSAEADAPSHSAYAKVAASLGVGLGLGAGASLPAAAAVSAAGVTGLARWSGSLLAKLLLLGVSGALLVGVGALLLKKSPSTQPVIQAAAVHRAASAPAVKPARVPAAAPASERVRSAKSAVESAAPSSARPVTSANTSSAGSKFGQGLSSAALHAPPALPPARRSSAVPATHASPDSSLAEQVQSLDRARVALANGDSSSALSEIARYRTAWPEGVFLTEASVLEVEALAARGEQSLARARAADFVAAHPDSPQSDRLRALIPSKKR